MKLDDDVLVLSEIELNALNVLLTNNGFGDMEEIQLGNVKARFVGFSLNKNSDIGTITILFSREYETEDSLSLIPWLYKGHVKVNVESCCIELCGNELTKLV